MCLHPGAIKGPVWRLLRCRGWMMIRFSGALLLALPAVAVFGAASAIAQYGPPPRGYYEERLPPVIDGYDDEDLLPPPRRAVRPGQRSRVLPYPDDKPPQPPTGTYYDYGRQLNPPPQQQAPQGLLGRATNDPDALRPPAAIGVAPQGPPASVTAVLPPDYQPETGNPKELPANLKKQLVDYSTKEPAGTIIIDTANTYLYLVLGGGKALRYGIGVGREGFTWAGSERVSKMSEWPDWNPPSEMIDRQPYLPRFMAGGPGNPLGARALYLGKTLYRIHGTNQPSTIGTFVSSGCIRLTNDDIQDLYTRVKVGTRVVVLPGGKPPATAAAAPYGQPAQYGQPAPPVSMAPVGRPSAMAR